MPRFHAGFSVGTVAGALLGAVMVALGVPVTAHLLGVARRWSRSSCRGRPRLPADDARHDRADTDGPAPAARCRPGREPRTLLIGLFVLAFAFTEGTGNDWIGVAVIDGYGTRPPSARSRSPPSWPR